MKTLLSAIKQWIAAQKVFRHWRKMTGGQCRFIFRIRGSVMAFTAPECESVEELAEILEEAAAILKASSKSKVILANNPCDQGLDGEPLFPKNQLTW